MEETKNWREQSRPENAETNKKQNENGKHGNG